MALVSMELPDNVKLIRDYDPSLPELAHDPEQIEQVLLNIVRNALQAPGPEGGEIILRTRTAFQLTLHGVRYRLAARIDVEDNGPGIPPHLQDTLFLPHGQRPRRRYWSWPFYRPQSYRSALRQN